MKTLIKAFLPEWLLNFLRPIYHGLSAALATLWYRFPSRKLTVVGITGTAGKSTTVNILAHILNNSGKKTGFITTTNYNVGNGEHLNKHGLSMPSGWIIQRQLREMITNGCTHAVVECTSEGLAQNRHLGIMFDMALMTNLSPAHLDAHKGFKNYTLAKAKLFESLGSFFGKRSKKIIGVNLDDSRSHFFLGFAADTYFGITTKPYTRWEKNITVYTIDNSELGTPSRFTVEETDFTLHVPGSFSISNAMLAIGASNMLGVNLALASTALNSFTGVPGRLEFIPNNKNVTAIVDYACEPAPFEAVLKTAEQLAHNKLIAVFGSTGGHRDTSKRFIFGELAAKHADHIIITNDDVYDSDPEEIARNIREGINQTSPEQRKATKIETILDRREAISHACTIAQSGDLILFLSKGSEQFLVLPGNKRMAWDERDVVREALQ